MHCSWEIYISFHCLHSGLFWFLLIALNVDGYDIKCYDMIWYIMIWYDMIWYDMTWYDMICLYDALIKIEYWSPLQMTVSIWNRIKQSTNDTRASCHFRFVMPEWSDGSVEWILTAYQWTKLSTQHSAFWLTSKCYPSNDILRPFPLGTFLRW